MTVTESDSVHFSKQKASEKEQDRYRRERRIKFWSLNL